MALLIALLLAAPPLGAAREVEPLPPSIGPAAADFTFDRGEAREMEGGVLRLADAGDEILLLDANASVIDAYVWGDSSYTGPGWTTRPAEKMGRGEIAVRLRRRAGNGLTGME